jgi:DnaJ like chaperone protein
LFKLIGIIFGAIFFGFWGGLLGFVVGSFFDQLRIYGVSGMSPMQNTLRQTVFLETVFISMGRIAKADGHVSQEEIDHVEQFMQKLGMTQDHRLQAIALFKRGADAAFDIEPTYKKFMSVCGRTQNLRQMLLVYLIVMALADGHFHPAEEAVLTDIAKHLGFDQASVKQMIEMVLNQSHFASGKANAADAMEDAYKALGVTKETSDADIKRAYRKLMSQYHPDKLMGQGVPEDMIAMATEQAKEIQLAYDLIKKNRNL